MNGTRVVFPPNPPPTSGTQTSTSLSDANLGEWSRAVARLRESLDIFEGIDNQVSVAMVIEIVAAIAGHMGQFDLAARMFGAAEALKDRLGGGAPSQLVRTLPFREATLRALGEEAFNGQHAEGARLLVAQAADLVRSFEPTPGAPPLPKPELWGVEAERRAAAVAVDQPSVK